MCQGSERRHRLSRHDSVPEGGELLVLAKAVRGISDPAWFETHEPLNELRRGPWPLPVFQECWGGGVPPGDVFPSGDSSGVASPAAKMSSIRDHSVSDPLLCCGEPCGPCRARSMI